MKIIKEGNIETFKGQCLKCGCEFEYNENDIVREYSTYEESEIFGGFGYCKRLECPCCGKNIVLESNFEPYERFSITKWIADKIVGWLGSENTKNG